MILSSVSSAEHESSPEASEGKDFMADDIDGDIFTADDKVSPETSQDNDLRADDNTKNELEVVRDERSIGYDLIRDSVQIVGMNQMQCQPIRIGRSTLWSAIAIIDIGIAPQITNA